MRSYSHLVVAAAVVAAGLSTAASATDAPACAGLAGISVAAQCSTQPVSEAAAGDAATVAPVNVVAAGPLEDVFAAAGYEDEWYYIREGLKEYSQTTLLPLIRDVRELVDNLPPAMAATPSDAR